MLDIIKKKGKSNQIQSDHYDDAWRNSSNKQLFKRTLRLLTITTFLSFENYKINPENVSTFWKSCA